MHGLIKIKFEHVFFKNRYVIKTNILLDTWHMWHSHEIVQLNYYD